MLVVCLWYYVMQEGRRHHQGEAGIARQSRGPSDGRAPRQSGYAAAPEGALSRGTVGVFYLGADELVPVDGNRVSRARLETSSSLRSAMG